MPRTITTYEHRPLYQGERKDELSATELRQLQAFYGSGEDFPYYRLIHRGVRFRSYVGVLRVGELTIEVLPKTDNHADDDGYWRSRLFDMLRVAHDLPLRSPSSTAHLRTRPHDVLHLYLRVLLETCENLHRRGLHRAYRAERANATALSGRLLFAEHLRHNLIHKERFFVERDRFDFATPLNHVLGQALRVARQLNGMRGLNARFQQLCEVWPELPDINATPDFFDRLRFPRGTEAYRPAVAIARLILLRHVPTTGGGRDLPALMFNVNRLWEIFLERTLQRVLPEQFTVSGQRSTEYWSSDEHSPATLRPDITIMRGNTSFAVLDAKWKVPTNDRPSSGDLQQLYTYAHHLGAGRVGLLYPGARPQVQGEFMENRAGLPEGRKWVDEVGDAVRRWLEGEAS